MSSIQTLLKRLIQNPSSIKSKSQAKQLNVQLLKTKSTKSPSSLSSIILSLYTNLNLYHESLIVFNILHPLPPPLAYKSIIRLYTSNGLFLKSLAAFVEFRASGEYPDHNFFPFVLKSCTHLMDMRFGESVHGCAIWLGLDFDLYTGNAIMNMFSKLHGLGINGGSSSVADEVFDKSPESRKNDKNRSGFVDTNKLIGNKVDGNRKVLNVGGNLERKGPRECYEYNKAMFREKEEVRVRKRESKGEGGERNGVLGF